MIGPRNNQNFTAAHNELYGHAAILRRYMKADDSGLMIAGQVQHGWTPGAGGIGISPMPIYVWNDRTWNTFKGANVISERIGAPFLYLPPDDTHMHVPRSLLAFPMHSTPGYPFENRLEGMERYAIWLDELRRAHGLSQITVCMALIDYNDFATVQMMRRYGHVVATCGGQFDESYLMRQRGFMQQHDIVTSNAVSTAIWYGGWLGRPIFVNGPIPKRVESSDNQNEHLAMETADHEWIAANFPDLPRTLDAAMPRREMGALELGAEHKKSPSELWDLMQLFYPRSGS